MVEFLSTKEIAAMFKVNKITVRRWINRKWLPAIKIGKMYRIKATDIEKLGKKR